MRSNITAFFGPHYEEPSSTGRSAMSEQGLIYRLGQWEVDCRLRELRARGEVVPIGGRAFEILQILVQSAPKLVTKDGLKKRVWPGAVVNENTIHVYISAVRKALGEDCKLLRTSSGRGYRLVGDWIVISDDGGKTYAEIERPSAVSSNLPTAGSPLIGRMLELEDLRALCPHIAWSH